MTSDHLDVSFAWKLLVASCVCVAEVRTRVFNVFVSSAKRVCLQRQVFVSGPAQNAFVASDAGPLSGLQRNALAYLVCFVV